MPSKAIQTARFGGVLAPVTLASAATVNIGAANAKDINISGTATIAAFDVAPAGTKRTLTFLDSAILSHNAVSLSLPGFRSFTANAGDTGDFLSLGGGNWVL